MVETVADELCVRLAQKYAVKPLPPCHVCGAPLSLSSAGGGSLPKYHCSALKTDFSTGAQSHYRASEHFHDHGDPDVIALLTTIESLQAMVAEAEGALSGLNAHVERMQGMCTAYLVPETYVAIGGMFGKNDEPTMRDKCFIADMIYMLDGPEQREAQSAAANFLSGKGAGG